MSELPTPLSFDWDEGNLEKNWEKHKVHYKEAEEVFFNKPLRIFPDPAHSEGEERHVAFGVTDQRRKLTVVFTLRKGKIRIVSARDQSRKERKEYGKKKS